MKNTIYTFPERVVAGIQVRDYTATYYGDLDKLIDSKADMFEYVEVYDDEHIETLAYDLFGDENQADTILASNQEVYLWSMPYNTDVLYELQLFYEKYLVKELNIGNGDVRVSNLEKLISEINDFVEVQNSEKRIFKVPKSSRLTDFTSVVDTYRVQNSVDDLDGEE